jgi:polyisoprenoid-binding protein YceI
MAVFSSQTRSSPAAVQLPSWTFDPLRSEASFCARRMGAIWVNGHFTDVRGKFYWDPEDPLSSSCVGEIDVANLHADEPQLNTQLRAADFLDPSRNRTINFAARVSERISETGFTADVLLTLRGTARHVAMHLSYLGQWDAPLSGDEGSRRMATRVGLRAEGVIKRQDFESVDGANDHSDGNALAGSAIEIALDLEAVLDEDLRDFGASSSNRAGAL